MRKLLILFIVFSFSICRLYSQDRTVKGRVIDDNLETLPYVSIMINDTVEVGRTDLKGFFQINIPGSEEKIVFMFLGLEPAIIEFVDKCDEVEVVMMLSGTHDFITLKKVDKLRMKRYRKLPELHKEAFEKGIFKTDKACYSRDFIPYYKKKNKIKVKNTEPLTRCISHATADGLVRLMHDAVGRNKLKLTQVVW